MTCKLCENLPCTCYKKPLDDDFNYLNEILSKIEAAPLDLYIIIEAVYSGGHSSSRSDKVTFCNGLDAVKRFVMEYRSGLNKLKIFKAEELSLSITLN